MRRVLVFISIVFLVLSVFHIHHLTTASPETTIFTDPETSRERPDGVFTIDIKVADVANLTGFMLAISWNASILNWTGMEYGGFLGPPEEVYWYTNITHIDDEVSLFIQCMSLPHQGVTGNGTLANMTFIVKAWGESTLKFGEESFLFGILEGETIPHITADGHFTNVEGPPVASFAYSPPTPKMGQTVFFNASESYDFGGSISNYTWEFSDGTTIVLNDPFVTHIFLAAKTYKVTLNVTDDVGESGIYTAELAILAPQIIFVDASNVGDPEEDGSPEHPFDMIQEGVNAAGWGDTVRVAEGTYSEHVTTDVSRLTLVGEDGSDTIIDGAGAESAVTVLANEVSISDFSIQNGEVGIYQVDSTAVTIRSNTLLNNGVGIDLRSSNNSEIIGNNITSSNDTGISLNASHNNIVIGNIISGNQTGIVVFKSSNNTFSGNTVEYNNVGVEIDEDGELNRFHHNNFTDNANHAVDAASNIWDDGYPSGGNYWSDYNGTDVKRGPYQNETGNDDIGDTPYVIDADSQDNYPLTPNWKDTITPLADAGSDRTVDEDTLVMFDGSTSWDNVGIMNYTWTFTDVTAQILIGRKPSYVFETPGVYPVTLIVTDLSGNWAIDNIEITVLDITKPVANAGQNQTVTVGTLVTFDASDSSDNVGIIIYKWDFGDNTPIVTDDDPVTNHTYTETGNFTVTLTVRDRAGNFDTDNVVVKALEETTELLPFWVIVAAIVAILGVVVGTALILWRRRETQRRPDARALR